MLHISTIAVVSALLLTAASGCTSASAKGKTISIGTKSFAENQIVGKVLQYALEDEGFTVNFVDNLENAVLQTALESKEIDLCPEYTNTGVASVLGLDPIFDPDEAYRVAKEQYEERFGITWLQQSSINNTYCFVVTREISETYGITTISDLQANAGNIRAAQHNSWEDRPDQLPALEEAYGKFAFQDKAIYDNGLKYQILLNGEGDLTMGYTTDPQLEDENLVVLVDDKNVWPPYYLAPIIRQEKLEEYPEIEEIVNRVVSRIDTEAIISLSADVVLRHEEYADVAERFYQEHIQQ